MKDSERGNSVPRGKEIRIRTNIVIINASDSAENLARRKHLFKLLPNLMLSNKLKRDDNMRSKWNTNIRLKTALFHLKVRGRKIIGKNKEVDKTHTNLSWQSAQASVTVNDRLKNVVAELKFTALHSYVSTHIRRYVNINPSIVLKNLNQNAFYGGF